MQSSLIRPAMERDFILAVSRNNFWGWRKTYNGQEIFAYV